MPEEKEITELLELVADYCVLQMNESHPDTSTSKEEWMSIMNHPSKKGQVLKAANEILVGLYSQGVSTDWPSLENSAAAASTASQMAESLVASHTIVEDNIVKL